MPLASVEPINGRKFFRIGPNGEGGWFVELRGPDWQDTYLQVWRKFPSFADAQAEAIRLGPMGDIDESS
jgi:hypothetical protein